MAKRLKSYYLEARYDARQSFYNKARVEEYSDGSMALYSYETRVAEINKNGIYKCLGKWSQTTTRHIREFEKQFSYLIKEVK